MTVFVFGNPDLQFDSLPLKILAGLRECFPEIDFQIKDPNEELELPKDAVIIDTVKALDQPRVFDSLGLEQFAPPPNLTLHDFDLFSHLKLLAKLNKLPKNIKIIGLPENSSPQNALEFIAGLLIPTSPSKNERRRTSRGHKPE